MVKIKRDPVDCGFLCLHHEQRRVMKMNIGSTCWSKVRHQTTFFILLIKDSIVINFKIVFNILKNISNHF